MRCRLVLIVLFSTAISSNLPNVVVGECVSLGSNQIESAKLTGNLQAVDEVKNDLFSLCSLLIYWSLVALSFFTQKSRGTRP